MTNASCRGCGASSDGAFCAACGQRQPRPDDFSLRRLGREAWSEISDTDSRLWRSLAGLFRPGVLTRAYLDYEWQQYLPPLRLYLIFSGIYFLLAWDLTFQLSVEMALAAPPGAMAAPVRDALQDSAATAIVSDLTALMKFLLVVVMGYWVTLLHHGSRRPVGEHLVFALHFMSLDFVLSSLQAPLVALAPASLQVPAYYFSLLLGLALLGVWAMLSVRVVYRRGWLSSAMRGLLILLMYVILSSLSHQIAIAIVIGSRY